MARLKRGIWIPVLLVMAGCASSPTSQQGGTQSNNAERIHFVESRKVDPSVRRNFDIAIGLLRDKKYDEGINLLKKVIEASQNNSAPYINMAIAYEKLGKIDLAEDSLKHALKINPDHPVANNEYALLLRKTGKYAEARKLYEKILKKYPDFMPARRNLGILCDIYLNDKSCALKQYQIYSQAHPDDKKVELWIVDLKKASGK